jgi:hypothetical protein
MKTVDVIDNFLEEDDFLKIKNVILSDNFSWYYSKYKVEIPQSNIKNYQFVHMFYYEHQARSEYFDILQPILKKLKIKALVKIKANLTTHSNDIYDFNYHVDNDMNCKTAIFYINSNNGYTLIGGEKIKSVENRMVIFDSEIPHAGSTCSDQSVRAILNINYF